MAGYKGQDFRGVGKIIRPLKSKAWQNSENEHEHDDKEHPLEYGSNASSFL